MKRNFKILVTFIVIFFNVFIINDLYSSFHFVPDDVIMVNSKVAGKISEGSDD